MTIIPAIDLIDGKCVRLTEGDFSQMTSYNESACSGFAFEEAGVKRIHLVDLDGAKTGKSKNRNIIKEIKKKTKLTVQTGGGIRTEEDIKDLLHSGIDYIILGTMLVEKLPLIQSMMGSYGHCFIAGVDVKDGFVKTHGWLDDKVGGY